MSIFPASKSILASEALLIFLKKNYSLQGNVQCELIKTWVNDTYLIKDDFGKYIFRVYRLDWRSKKEIESEINVISLLKSKEISVSFPLNDKDGKIVQTFNAAEGTRFGVLFSFANGEKSKGTNSELEFQVGEMMAKMHQHFEHQKVDRIIYNEKTLLENSLTGLGQKISKESDEFLLLKNIQQCFYKKIKEMKTEDWRTGIVHFDFWYDNFHVDENNEITLFDFDFMGNGWLILDIAFHSVITFITEPNEEKYKALINDFYKGYESIFSIHEEEKIAIPMLGSVILMYYLNFQNEKFGTVFANENHIKAYINLRIKRWCDFTNFLTTSTDIS